VNVVVGVAVVGCAHVVVSAVVVSVVGCAHVVSVVVIVHIVVDAVVAAHVVSVVVHSVVESVGGSVAVVSVGKQILQPDAVSEKSLSHLIGWLSTVPSAGPVVPLYVRPLTVNLSYLLSVANA
jgi:hypothetical protein